MRYNRSHKQHTRTLLRVLIPLLNSDLLEVLGLVWRHSKRVISRKVHEGMYEVLEYKAQLELQDEGGKKAVLTKRQRVRFLQDRILAYQDKAWGDGDMFADYQCSPGVAVDRYREGHCWYVLISLRKTVNRGDSEVFHIERTIKNGFSKGVEDFQTEIDHTTRKFEISVVFPKKRPPKRVTLIEQNTSRTTPLGPEHCQLLPDGRHQITWSTDNPRLFEAYIIHWEW